MLDHVEWRDRESETARCIERGGRGLLNDAERTEIENPAERPVVASGSDDSDDGEMSRVRGVSAKAERLTVGLPVVGCVPWHSVARPPAGREKNFGRYVVIERGPGPGSILPSPRP